MLVKICISFTVGMCNFIGNRDDVDKISLFNKDNDSFIRT